MKVLVVDDNHEARQMVKTYVLKETDECRECEDGSEALSAYAEFRPDWVLMDWDMKEVNGLVATQNIMASFPEARILIVTSFDEANLRRAANQAGACGYVLKDNLLELRKILNDETT
jgi:two-component system, NarL family, response regulator LiaR